MEFENYLLMDQTLSPLILWKATSSLKPFFCRLGASVCVCHLTDFVLTVGGVKNLPTWLTAAEASSTRGGF